MYMPWEILKCLVIFFWVEINLMVSFRWDRCNNFSTSHQHFHYKWMHVHCEQRNRPTHTQVWMHFFCSGQESDLKQIICCWKDCFLTFEMGLSDRWLMSENFEHYFLKSAYKPRHSFFTSEDIKVSESQEVPLQMNACITVYLLIENMQESVAKVGFSRASSQTLLRLTLNSQD
jgi:hypothetical protein